MPVAISSILLAPPQLAQWLAALEPLTQFGVAGLMGTLWVWERYLSRNRENQLTEAHQLIRDERKQLAILIDLVHQNTQALHRVELTTAHLERVAEHEYATTSNDPPRKDPIPRGTHPPRPAEPTHRSPTRP